MVHRLRSCFLPFGLTRGIVKRLSLAIALVVLLYEAFYGLRVWRDNQAKALSTDFSRLRGHFAPPAKLVRYWNGPRIDDQYVYMRHLGHGREGSTALYVDSLSGEVVTVKTFTTPSRNALPAELAGDFAQWASTWPSEIQAGLLLQEQRDVNGTVFVEVRDYFVIQDDNSDWVWTMVTPFCQGGTLEDLAEQTTVHERTPQKLDVIFRPVLRSLLGGLQTLHQAGYCHDDIKPDNIFVKSTMDWLLGDLGSVRETTHPWHFTQTLKEQNQWSDCISNDIRRLLKSYLWFLRHASGHVIAFDEEFYKESQAWSALYWQFVRDPVPIKQTLYLSDRLDPSRDPEWKASDYRGVSTDECLKERIELELTCTTISKRWWNSCKAP